MGDPLTITDPDGDTITVKKVGGFGEPMLVLRANQSGDEASVNLTIPFASQLRDYLTGFIFQNAPDGKV